jgi:integrase
VCEYTPKRKHKQRTIPITKKHVQLFNGPTPINPHAPLRELLSATAVTITIPRQKNGTTNQTLHPTTTSGLYNPVAAAARRLHHLRNAPDDTGIWCYYNSDGTLEEVLPNHVNTLVRLAAEACKLSQKGFSLKQISSHSLRATGAVLMLLAGLSEPEIQLRGRWSGDTWKQYIQPTIAAVKSKAEKFSEMMSQSIYALINLSIPTSAASP